MKQKFIEILKKHGVELSQQQIQQFDMYAKLLVEWNQKMNLTAIEDIDEIYEKHFLDSVLPSFEHDFFGNVCDVGAGAGFPSIPLKIVYPELNITIVEPLKKRIQFLTHLIDELNITVTLENKRSEEFVLEKREFFDVVCARAVANLTVLSEICIPLLKKDGFFIALKGQKGDEELAEASFALKELGVELVRKSEYLLGDATRNNFQFKKVKNTPLKYPRNYGKIKKEPLVGRKK